jgi:hypothetical protein
LRLVCIQTGQENWLAFGFRAGCNALGVICYVSRDRGRKTQAIRRFTVLVARIKQAGVIEYTLSLFALLLSVKKVISTNFHGTGGSSIPRTVRHGTTLVLKEARLPVWPALF